METAAAYQLIASPLEETIKDLIGQAKESLFISAPYIKSYGADVLLAGAKARRLSLLTNLSLANVSGAGFDFDALIELGKHFEMAVSSLEKLHAKIYIADDGLALVTSANLTLGGLRENYEYGVLIRDLDAVNALKEDMTHYFSLGNIFQRHALIDIWESVREIKKLRAELDKTSPARKLKRALSAKEESFQIKALTNRVEGRTINSIFSETILYLLRRYRTLTTQQLHAHIKEIHPDICDDSVDRVINGQHFGKKWKHMVRNAQQHLKANGMICLRNGRWELTA